MNPKIILLKIKGIKKKLHNEVSFLSPTEIFLVNEQAADKEFIENVNSSTDREIKWFSIYDKDEHKYLDEDDIYNHALSLLKKQFVFERKELICFSIDYMDQHFMVVCKAKDFYDNWNNTFELSKFPIIYNTNHSILLELSRLEYDIEVSLWRKKRDN